MSSIAPPTSVAQFLQATSVRAMDAAVIYDGEVPERPLSIYHMSGHSRRHSYVYMFCRDEQVLYVGMSRNPGARYERHRQKAIWFYPANRYVLVEFEGGTEHEARSMARFVENRAIRLLKPGFNIVGAA